MRSKRMARFAAKRILSNSSLFDADWYSQTNADIKTASIEPLDHYVWHGASEGRDPSPVFDTEFYLAQFIDLDRSLVNPLCHYILIGEYAGAWPNKLFDPKCVETALPTTPGKTLLEQALSPSIIDLETSAEFSMMRYLADHPDLALSGLNPLRHKLEQQHQTAPTPEASLDGVTLGNIVAHKSNDLRPLIKSSRLSYFHIIGHDPFIELHPTDKREFAPGHYQLKFHTETPVSELHNPKLYFGSDSGYSETNTTQLSFKNTDRGEIIADFLLPQHSHKIRFDPTDVKGDGKSVVSIGSIKIEPIKRPRYYLNALKDTSPTAISAGRTLAAIAADIVTGGTQKAAARLREKQKITVKANAAPKSALFEYQQWINRFGNISPDELTRMQSSADDFDIKPKFSIILPVYNTPADLLSSCLDSVIKQIYNNWELCVSDDASNKPHVREILEKYASKDPRIKVKYRPKNGHISEASNSALELATGEWIALLDHDDIIPMHALFCVAEQINRTPDAMLIYSDEDKIDTDGIRKEPYFKPDWNERLFYEQNMISHLGIYKRSLIEEIGGFRKGFEGAQDHDLALRYVERITPEQIVHIPNVLYHWRIIEGSTALNAGEKTYALKASEKAIAEALKRRGLSAKTKTLLSAGYTKVIFDLPSPPPLVSIIIPTRDGLDVLKPCIESLRKLTDYASYEVIIVDNQSEKKETLEYFDSLSADAQIKIIRYDEAFNYSAINNFAVTHSSGEYICLLNNDTEVIAPGWLSSMVSEISQTGVGAVGAKLLYTDRTVQHAGVILGVGGEKGVAGHALLGIDQNSLGYFSNNLLAREVSAVTAACLLTKRTIFEEVNGLNEKDLRVAFNDIDFCLKVREAGYKVIWTPDALLFHHESKTRGLETTPEKQARFMKEVDYMLSRWGGLLQSDPYYNPNLALDAESFSIAHRPRVGPPEKAK